MPMYDYQCQDCKTIFSVNMSFSSSICAVLVCPCCHKENIKKLIKNFNVIYKGSGFYTTDSEKKKENTS